MLGVAHVFRFEESTAWLRRQVAAGQIGRIVFARSEFSFPAGPGHPRAWINDPAVAGGGPIADVGVHCIDSLRYILQDEVVRVSARGFQDALSGEQEAAAALTLEFSRGTLGTVLVSFRSAYRTPLELVGETGVLRGDDVLNVERPITLELWRAGSVVETESVSNQYAYARQVDAFAAAVEGKAKFPVSGEEGWQNQVILDAAYRGLKSGKVEEVDAGGMKTQLSVLVSVISCRLLIAGHRLRGRHAFRLHDRPVPFLIVGWSGVQGFVEDGS